MCDCLQLKLQAVMSFLVWVLGTELESSARDLCALKHGAIAPALNPGF